jgi:uncharacterized protein (TIGR00251 family)
MDPPFRADGDDLVLAVRLTPRAGRSEVGGVVDAGDGRPALAVRIAAAPVEGAANKALVAFLAKTLGIPKSRVTIESGDRSRLKLVRLGGVSPAQLGRLI